MQNSEEQICTPSEVFDTRWCVITQEMATRQIQTPQGIQVIQQPVEVPLFFRNDKEIIRFLQEHQQNNAQIVLVMRSFNVGDPNIKYVYA